LGILILIALGTALGPWVWGRGYADANLDALNIPPGAGGPLGTDALGRDVLGRILIGGRISVGVAVVSQISAMIIAVPAGMVAGLAGGWTDGVLMRLIDVLMTVPDLLLIILLVPVLTGAFGQPAAPLWILRLNEATGGAVGVTVALAFPTWMILARLVRAHTLSLRAHQFIEAAISIGAGPARIMTRHLLPNLRSVIVVWLTLAIPRAVLLEAGISFLGMGIQPPLPSWGTMIAEGVQAARSTPHLLMAPAGALGVTVLALNLMGDALRDALDPLTSWARV
jgi:ABC-type dipeptide/oligopeptide/nickel transport system permease subunit